jgi:DNA-binding transcriptional ArsR family regulator
MTAETVSATLELVEDEERAVALLNPLRLRIVEELREPDSASGLARKLSLPRQRLNYHLRELEAWGFVELVEERRKGNCTERILRTTARSYVVAPRALGELAPDPDRIGDRFSSAYLVALAARAIRDVALLRERARKAGKKLPTLSVQTEVCFASAEEREAFTQELTSVIEELVRKYHDQKAPGGRRFELFLGSYPAVKKIEGPQPTKEEKQ